MSESTPQHPCDKRPTPDETTLRTAMRLKELGDQDPNDHRSLGSISIGLDLEDYEFTIRTDWLSDIDADWIPYLHAHIAIMSIVRYIGHQEPENHDQLLHALAAGTDWDLDDWTEVDSLEWEDVWYEIELVEEISTKTFRAYLTADVPEGLDIGTIGEPIALLREFLINHEERSIALACGTAYHALANWHDARIGSTRIKERVALQKSMPNELLVTLGASRDGSASDIRPDASESDDARRA